MSECRRERYLQAMLDQWSESKSAEMDNKNFVRTTSSIITATTMWRDACPCIDCVSNRVFEKIEEGGDASV